MVDLLVVLMVMTAVDLKAVYSGNETVGMKVLLKAG
jgi:hypothetical protein